MSNKVYIETYGCSFNVADGEAMAGVLDRAGHRLVDQPDAADVIILNTCTVKDRTFRNFEKRFRGLREAARSGSGPQVVLAGCIPKAHERSDMFEGVSSIGPDTIDRLDEVVRETAAGRVAQRLRRSSNEPAEPDRLRLPSLRRNPLVEVLPISSGCMSACGFCQTRLARGRLRSFPPGDILRKVHQAVEEGVREIWLTSQDTGAYGKDCDWPLPRLLRRICEIEGDFRVRLGMSSPQWIEQDLEAYLDAFEHPRMFRFLHVPVQSGSRRVLEEMRRGHGVGEFERVCDGFRARFPDACLMTDVIAGFPTERDEDFEATLDLLARVRPAAVNRSKFSPRPGTAAARLRALPDHVLTERSRRLDATVRGLAHAYHRQWVGRSERVLTFEYKNERTTLAHNRCWRPVVLEGRHALAQWVEVQYTGAGDFHLLATP